LDFFSTDAARKEKTVMKANTKISRNIVYLAGVLTMLLFAISSCEDSSPYDSQLRLNDTLSIRIGTMAEDENHTTGLRFDSVVADCRCPEDVVCVWAGYAEAKLKFVRNTTEHTFTLFIEDDTLIENYKIKLIDILPHPNTHIKIDPDRRIAKVLITHP
jgi:hypothetical protein